VPEGEKADIADEEAEGAREECKAQRLHEEHGIDEERGEDEEHEHDPERENLVGGRRGHLRRTRRLDVVARGGGHQAVRPNRPAGFTRRTRTMMTKITVFEASG
jgi:hypothetical protein